MARPKIRKGTSTLYLRCVPRGVHDFFKSACARRGRTMKNVILEFMREFVEQDQVMIKARKAGLGGKLAKTITREKKNP